MNIEEEKLYSNEAEQAVIGGLLIDNDSLDQISSIISNKEFYIQNHRIIFESICEMLNSNLACDIITICEVLEQKNSLEKIGGLSYIGSLVNNTPSASNIVSYAEIVREKSILRQILRTSSDTSNDVLEQKQGRDSNQIIQSLEQKIFEIEAYDKLNDSGFTSIKEIIKTNSDEIIERSKSDEKFSGLPTGFVDLDEKINGLKPGNLIVIAGRPSQGKTSLAMNIALNCAVNNNAKVGVFSLEMTKKDLAFRLTSSLGEINLTNLMNGNLDDYDWEKSHASNEILRECSIEIDDTPLMTPNQMRSRARKLKRTSGLDLIIVDYLQQMKVPGINPEKEHIMVQEISSNLKALSKELNVPVIALSQLNRGVEQRINKRPMMSDLRSSGAIEQDADIIMFVYRDEFYNKNTLEPGIAEIILGKQRNGITDTVKLNYSAQFTKFENI